MSKPCEALRRRVADLEMEVADLHASIEELIETHVESLASQDEAWLKREEAHLAHADQMDRLLGKFEEHLEVVELWQVAVREATVTALDADADDQRLAAFEVLQAMTPPQFERPSFVDDWEEWTSEDDGPTEPFGGGG